RAEPADGRGSKPELQRQLERARSAFLKKRIEPAQRLIQHRQGEKFGRRVRNFLGRGVGEVRMIQGVEGIGAKLQMHPLGDRKSTCQRNVDLGQPKTRNVVSWLVSLLAAGRGQKCRRIYSLPAGTLLSRGQHVEGLECGGTLRAV